MSTARPNVSDVWFSVTDLDVVSGSGSWVTTTDGTRVPRLLRAASPSPPPATATRTSSRRSSAGRAVHPRPGQRVPPRPARAAGRDALAELAPAGIDTFFFANSGRRDHRGRGQAGQAGHRAAEHHRVQRQLPRPHAPGDGDDHVEDRLPRRARRRCRPACSSPRSPTRSPPTRTPRSTAASTALRHLLTSQTAPAETAAMILEPVLGEGGYIPAPDGVPRRARRASAASTASCSSPTRCRAASAAPARCSRSSTTASSPTSSAWRRASRRASRSPPSAPRASSWRSGRRAATAAPTAATRSAARRRSPPSRS